MCILYRFEVAPTNIIKLIIDRPEKGRIVCRFSSMLHSATALCVCVVIETKLIKLVGGIRKGKRTTFTIQACWGRLLVV